MDVVFDELLFFLFPPYRFELFFFFNFQWFIVFGGVLVG